MDYKPLAKEEREKISKDLELFYQQVKSLNSAKKEYENSMLDLRIKRVRNKESFSSIAKSVEQYKLNIKSIDALIETIRPATPEGELVCHSCDAKGMALVEKNYKGSDSNLYRCQVCDAKYAKDELLDFI